MTGIFDKMLEVMREREKPEYVVDKANVDTPIYKKVDEESLDLGEEYFEKFPYDEKLVRQVIGGLKGIYFRNDVDTDNIPLNKILAPPNARFGKIAIESLTEGPGEHLIMFEGFKFGKVDLPQEELAVTINNLGFLCGSLRTFIFTRNENGLKNKEIHTHIMS